MEIQATYNNYYTDKHNVAHLVFRAAQESAEGIDAELAGAEVVTLRVCKSEPEMQSAYDWITDAIYKIAKIENRTTQEIKNEILKEAGVVKKVGGVTVTVDLVDTEEAEKEAGKELDYALRRTDHTHTNTKGRTYRTHVLIKQVREHNSREIGDLLKKTNEKLTAAGIAETASERVIEYFVERLEREEGGDDV